MVCFLKGFLGKRLCGGWETGALADRFGHLLEQSRCVTADHADAVGVEQCVAFAGTALAAAALHNKAKHFWTSPAVKTGIPHIGEPLSRRAAVLTTSFLLPTLEAALGCGQRVFELRRSQLLEALRQFASVGVGALVGLGHGDFLERRGRTGPPQAESAGGLGQPSINLFEPVSEQRRFSTQVSSVRARPHRVCSVMHLKRGCKTFPVVWRAQALNHFLFALRSKPVLIWACAGK
jgi:hypothetical protein